MLAQRQKNAELNNVRAAIPNHVLPCGIPLSIRLRILLSIFCCLRIHGRRNRLFPAFYPRGLYPRRQLSGSGTGVSGRSTTTVQISEVHVSPDLFRSTDSVFVISTGLLERSR